MTEIEPKVVDEARFHQSPKRIARKFFINRSWLRINENKISFKRSARCIAINQKILLLQNSPSKKVLFTQIPRKVNHVDYRAHSKHQEINIVFNFSKMKSNLKLKKRIIHNISK